MSTIEFIENPAPRKLEDARVIVRSESAGPWNFSFKYRKKYNDVVVDWGVLDLLQNESNNNGGKQHLSIRETSELIQNLKRLIGEA